MNCGHRQARVLSRGMEGSGSGRQNSAPSGPSQTPSDRPQRDAAEAIAAAEAALAHQNSASAQLDLLVISAILNAHLEAVEGKAALNQLQQEIQVAVRTRSDLDTPAGARDFQRFLISKLRDIRAVVANASLDDTSKSALMAAWTSLYGVSKTGPGEPSEGEEQAGASNTAPARGAFAPVPSPTAAGDPLVDPLLWDPLLWDDPGPLPEDLSPRQAAAPLMPMMPSIPGIPNIGGGTTPGSAPGWNGPGGPPISDLLRGSERDPIGLDEVDWEPTEPEPEDHAIADEPDERAGVEDDDAAAPTTVTLPNGETVTAASPELAAAIKAAAGGASIADAFQQQGITIPAPGTAVNNPIAPERVIPGDIGIFTDRHALALGRDQALLEGQIQHISSVTGPSFLGWEHPPAVPAAPASGRTEQPTPTRPAATSATWQ